MQSGELRNFLPTIAECYAPLPRSLTEASLLPTESPAVVSEFCDDEAHSPLLSRYIDQQHHGMPMGELLFRLYINFHGYTQQTKRRIIDLTEYQVAHNRLHPEFMPYVFEFYEDQLRTCKDHQMIMSLFESYQQLLQSCDEEEECQRVERLYELIKDKTQHFFFHDLVLKFFQERIENGSPKLRDQCLQSLNHLIYFGDLKIAFRAVNVLKRIIQHGQTNQETLSQTLKHLFYPFFWRGTNVHIKNHIVKTATVLEQQFEIDPTIRSEITKGLAEIVK